MALTKQDNILEMHNISKSFLGVAALEQVNFTVARGSIHALIGENGAGKSTMMKILSGIYKPDEGTILFDGQERVELTPMKALDMGVAMIHQELSPIPEMSVAENIFLGREPMAKGGILIDYKKMYRDTEALFREIGVSYDPTRKIKDLCVADMQMIEIVKAVSRNAKLVVMDEPTSSLTNSETELLFRQIERLRECGIAVIYISHKLEEIFEICSEITVLRDGRIVESGRTADYTMDKLVTLMVGRTISDVYPKEKVPIKDVMFEVKNLTIKGSFEDVSFKVHQGEILGITGLVGAGRTEVARGIFGLDPLDKGEIWLDGKRITIRNPKEAIGYGITMASEDRKNVGLVLCRSVSENISLTNLNKFTKHILIDVNKEGDSVREMIQQLQIKVPSPGINVSNLSGGNQQKVVLAKWMMGDIKVMIFDEPTRGIDVGTKYEIYKMIVNMAREGIAVIMISSEMPEVLGISDRILVMSQGKVTGEMLRENCSQEDIMRCAIANY